MCLAEIINDLETEDRVVGNTEEGDHREKEMCLLVRRQSSLVVSQSSVSGDSITPISAKLFSARLSGECSRLQINTNPTFSTQKPQSRSFSSGEHWSF